MKKTILSRAMSALAKKRWTGVSKKDRSSLMSELAQKRWKK